MRKDSGARGKIPERLSRARPTQSGMLFARAAGWVVQSTYAKEAIMKHARAVRWGMSILMGLGVSLAVLALPTSAQAGGVNLSIGIGSPFPVQVVPAPVWVAPPPPVVVYPAPVVMYPAPVVMYPAPVVIGRPYPAYPYHLPPGHAKRYYGRPVYGYKYYR
jgi:hypothetical protein